MKRIGLLVSVVLLVAGAFVAYTTVAQPVRREVLKELRMEEVGGCQTITAELQFPIVLQGFSPAHEGALLVVRVMPLQTLQVPAEAVFGREALVPEGNEETPLQQVSWEGDAPAGPQLVFQFSRTVTYEVTNGTDFRSVVLTLRPDTTDPAPCKSGKPVAPRGAR
jgi:hypothetical protein